MSNGSRAHVEKTAHDSLKGRFLGENLSGISLQQQCEHRGPLLGSPVRFSIEQM